METDDTAEIRPVPDSETGAYQATFDIDREDPSTVVVTAISAISGADPLDLEPLNERLDPDCLDGLFRSKQDGTPRGDGGVTFPFAGFDVTVRGHGEVVLTPLE